jgi:tetratricopeptide (TPR) repeat protein
MGFFMSERSASSRQLRIFLCHSSDDKQSVRALYQKLLESGFQPWLDEIDLLPGQYWKKEIPKAVRESDVVLICLSRKAVNKRGYIQKEIKFALDVADEQPEGTIYLIPIKLEDCTMPERLSDWQWVNLYDENGFDKLVRSLERGSEALGIPTSSNSSALATNNSFNTSSHDGRDAVSEFAPRQSLIAPSLLAEEPSERFESGPRITPHSTTIEDPILAEPVQAQASDLKPFQGRTVTPLQVEEARIPEPKRRMSVLIIISIVLLIVLVMIAIWALNRARDGTVPDTNNTAVTHYNLGLTLAAQQKFVEAEREYREAIRLNPNSASAHNGLGIALGNQGKLAEADTEFREAIRIDPNYPEAHNYLGVSLGNQGRFPEAEAEYKEAIRLNPAYAEARYNMGLALGRQKKHAEAEAEFREIIRIDPNSASAHNGLGFALYSQERYTEAAAAFRKALVLPGNYAAVSHDGLGLILAALTKYGAAVSEYKKAIESDPNYSNAHYDLAIVWGRQTKYQDAEDEFKEARRLNPNYNGDADFHYHLGLVLGLQGKFALAGDEFRAATNLNQNHAAAYNALGIVMTGLHKEGEARLAYSDALRVDPSFPLVQNDLKQLLNRKK